VQQASRNPEMDYVALFIGGVAGRAEPSTGLATHFATFTPFAWYQNPEVNNLAMQMAATTDNEARGEAIQALGKAVHADYRYIPLWTNSHIYGMKSCIDFTPTLGEYDIIMLRDVSIARCGQ
jgi:ABC-type transport system substrate-binding protein